MLEAMSVGWVTAEWYLLRHSSNRQDYWSKIIDRRRLFKRQIGTGQLAYRLIYRLLSSTQIGSADPAEQAHTAIFGRCYHLPLLTIPDAATSSCFGVTVGGRVTLSSHTFHSGKSTTSRSTKAPEVHPLRHNRLHACTIYANCYKTCC